MKIYSSSTKKEYELKDQNITIYNCGPTVYNYVHIGNVRPLIIFDVLHRYLLKIGKNVKFVHNITDVDDKIIAAASKANITEKELSTKYLNAYLDLFDLLNIKKLIMPKVSDHIDDIIEYIKKLVANGAAYVANGDVYFDIQKIPNYGHVSHKNINELLDGARKENKENKKYPLDFALWKKTDIGINWDSPWSKGRPGWHTECCVLINMLIGDHVTIHGGGIDLKFPHHENENAQNFALFNKDIADIWMHIGHVNVDGAKMSKSLNNFILVKDIITNENANGLRWFFYRTKYQHPINYSTKMLQESNIEINKIIKTLAVAKTYLLANNKYQTYVSKLNPKFAKALDNDLNLPIAISLILEEIKQLNINLRNNNWDNVNKLYFTIGDELNILGIKWDIFNHQKYQNLIDEWKKVINSKDYKKIDTIRSKLQKINLL